MKEEDRLAAVVASIDHEVGVVPHGAYIKTPLGGIKKNPSFEGNKSLSHDDMVVVVVLNFYWYFRSCCGQFPWFLNRHQHVCPLTASLGILTYNQMGH